MKKAILTISALMISAMISTGALATVPDLIPVQGVLADSADAPVDALTDLTFTLYDGEASSTVLWTDTFVDVDVVEGFFTVYLGDNTALDFGSLITNAEVWVGITVESDPEMDRFQLATVPFAIEAQVSQQVGSLTEANINSNFVSSSSPAAGVTAAQISNWDTAYGWGDHSGLYAPLVHNHDDLYYTETEMQTSGSAELHWNNLTNVPAGFADGVDNFEADTNAATICAAGQYLNGSGSCETIPSQTPAGSITMFAGNVAPSGYSICDGSEVSRATYSDLFTAIGTAYGAGDGSTTFNLPDLRGRVPVGMNGTVTEFDSLNNQGGEMAHTLTTSEMPSHTHTGTAASAGNHAHSGTAASAGNHAHSGTAASAGSHGHTASTNSTGSHGHSVSLYGAQQYNFTYTPDTFAAPFIRDYSTTNYGDGYYDDMRFYDGAALHTATDVDWMEIGHASNVTSGSAGTHSHTVTVNANGTHTHTISTNTTGAHTHAISTNTTGAHTHTVTNSSTGGDAAHNVLQPYVVLNYVIKL